MMSLQLGETFSGFKIHRLVQWVLHTPNPLLFKCNELPKFCFAPLVSQDLLQPWLMHLQIPFLFLFLLEWACVASNQVSTC